MAAAQPTHGTGGCTYVRRPAPGSLRPSKLTGAVLRSQNGAHSRPSVPPLHCPAVGRFAVKHGARLPRAQGGQRQHLARTGRLPKDASRIMSEAGIRSSGHADNHACGNSAHPGGGAAPALAAAAAAPDWDDLTPLGRLEMLCDPGSVQVIRSAVRSNRLGTKPSDGEGVAGASGAIAGRPIFCYAEDGRFAGGSLGPADASTILRILELAGKARAPVVGFVDCAGARLQEGAAALGAYARVFRSKVRLSGKVPQISIVTGSPPAGGCQSPALADFTLMTRSTSMFLAGPPAVRAMPGAQAPAFDLRG